MVPNSFFGLDVESRFAMLLMVDRNSTPEEREQARRRIKAMPYDEFLTTTYWHTIRDYVVFKHDGKCYSCIVARAVNVHHRTYEHHGQEHLYLTDLMPVCRTCHEILHEKSLREGRIEGRIQNVFEMMADLINGVGQ